ncbi:MAG: IS256 family transposase [Candidatus Eisenbacteria sp.]|nr:IS256 family transposase [Candidatus Eisenbacteria bacterium]
MSKEHSTTSDPAVIPLRVELQDLLRTRILATVEEILDEELGAALGCERHERTDERRGYRNGSHTRRITTEVGPLTMRVPRGRLRRADGTSEEFESHMLPRYARRTRRVDEAILGTYLAGANTRRIRKALRPLLGEEHLSKSAISRVVGRLKEHFGQWVERDLSDERYEILYLDGLNLKVRLARRVVSVPVLAALGVTPEGQKQLVALQLAASEASACWSGLLESLRRRGLADPVLLVTDGHAGLRKAREAWSVSKVQRCAVHKRENLLEHCPVHARAEVTRDYNQIINAPDGIAARKAYDAFLAKWRTLCPPVARSLEEAGTELLTFYEFPKAMWKSLRTTNSIENLNREFRRRTKTQASFPTEAAAVTLLYGLVAFGQITLRKIDGHKAMKGLLDEGWTTAA